MRHFYELKENHFLQKISTCSKCTNVHKKTKKTLIWSFVWRLIYKSLQSEKENTLIIVQTRQSLKQTSVSRLLPQMSRMDFSVGTLS